MVPLSWADELKRLGRVLSGQDAQKVYELAASQTQEDLNRIPGVKSISDILQSPEAQHAMMTLPLGLVGHSGQGMSDIWQMFGYRKPQGVGGTASAYADPKEWTTEKVKTIMDLVKSPEAQSRITQFLEEIFRKPK